ncbi:dephospho-CoA kinase [Rhizobium sp. Leaf384]|uniref:dephospho-CoA kinase n=1 Tax=unclassified Rhizobium TaxID=2613769 RepID=UPI000715042B|nr:MULTISPECIES: dephospho-CoA kinase [unclassified Rhizobium]KQS76103.1 dephospho-CoA kinase [Rhizobium sp. Leaf384]KQS85848.1 dephospho-CoA kinase [Rhizobium sp. Leaf383]
MIVLGLTGSIGMGKSTTAEMFKVLGVPVNDADAVVHALYHGPAVGLIEAAFPGSTLNGAVDRTKLSAALARHPQGFKTLEAIVHPLVREEERAFLERERRAGAPLVVLDIPLLFETGGEARVDAVAVVTCDADLQRQRVLARPGMTPEKFALILSRQMPDSDKRARANYVIDTSRGLEVARQRVEEIVTDLTKRAGQAPS